jgi:hypothetical protein
MPCVSRGVAEEIDHKLIDAIVAGIEANDENIRYLQVEYETDTEPKEAPAKPSKTEGRVQQGSNAHTYVAEFTPIFHSTHKFKRYGNSYRIDRDYKLQAGGAESWMRRGDIYGRLYFVDSKPHAWIGRLQDIGGMSAFDLRECLAGEEGKTMIDILEKEEIDKAAKGTGIDGSEVAIVTVQQSADYYAVFEFDPAKHYLPVARYSFHRGGRLLDCETVTYQPICNGKSYYPLKIVQCGYKSFQARLTDREKWSSRTTITCTTKPDTETVVTADDIEFKLPPGTAVDDVIVGQHFVTP